MDKSVSWTVDMSPFGKARPRVTRRGTFMPDEYEAKRDELRWLSPPLDDISPPYGLRVVAARRIPANGRNRRRRPGEPCDATPDADNILGAVMDALFAEDSAVVEVACRKVWGEEDSLSICVWRVEDGE